MGKEIYNEEYYKNYDAEVGTVNYMESEDIKGFLQGVAKKIVDELHPKMVLDAGCATGHLVAALRDLGVEAYGIDISEYTISVVREDVRPFCCVGSLADPLPPHMPKRYDLVVTIEVLEHLTAADGEKAIRNLCSYTDQVLFSSTPDDFEDPTHINVRQREYWSAIFATAGFYDNVFGQPQWLTPYAVLYCRNENISDVISTYERFVRHANQYMSDDRPKRTINSKVYFDFRKGVSEGACHTFSIKEGEYFKHRFSVPAGCKAVRFDPIEDYGCLIRNLTARSDGELLKIVSSNGFCLNNLLLFKSMDPQICFQELPQFTQWIELEAEILSFDSVGWLQIYDKMEELNCDLEAKNAEIKEQREELEAKNAEAKQTIDELQNRYDAISNATFWKMTKPLRVFTNAVKAILRSNRFTNLIGKGIMSLFKHGFSFTYAKVKQKLWTVSTQRAMCKGRLLPTAKELKEQEKTVFPRDITFSILVPLYNTPEKYLREMIRSVQNQTYGKWELCLADGSDAEHANVGAICQKYAQKDKRIHYQKLEKNLGISGNTNACIDMAIGDYISLFDHDDLLHPSALFATMKAICEQNADFVYTDETTFYKDPEHDAFNQHFKPDYAPDTLRANNYICHFTSFSKSLLNVVGKFRPECDGSQDFDMMLRLTEQAKKIVHIPQILYFWRAHPNSVAEGIEAKPYVIEAAKRAIRDHLQRVGLKGEVLDSVVPSMYRLRYEIDGMPFVSIIIPNYENKSTLKNCLDSIFEKSTYRNFEVIIVENNSKSQEIFAYYKEIQEKWENVRVITWDGSFNYSAINNFGARFTKGEHLLLLNNDTEVISPDWIQEMLMYSQRSDVGAVGAKLYYPDNTVQHAGLGIGLLTLAGHLHRNFDRNHPGYMGRLIYAQDLSGVTAACVMLRREVWDEIGGFDESFAVAFNDVDMCMRIRKAGYLIVWTPFAELYHYESKSRGTEDTPEKQKRFQGEVERFQARWRAELDAGDPYYNPNFRLDREDFSFKQ